MLSAESAMKLDLSKTFLNGDEDVTAALAPQTARVRWGRRAVLIAILLPVVGYLVLIGSALYHQLRPASSELPDGWFRLADRDQNFEVELPSNPSRRTLGSQIEYQSQRRTTDTTDGFLVTVRCDSVGRQLLNSTPVKLLRSIMQAEAAQGAVTPLGSGVGDSKTHWIEYRVQTNGGADPFVMRRRLIIHGTQLLDVTVHVPERDVMSRGVDRVMNTAHWTGRCPLVG